MPRLIFLDTSVIRQANFALVSAPFRFVRELAAHGAIEVLTTDITLAECESVLMEELEKTVGAMKKANTMAQLFSNLEFDSEEVVMPLPDVSGKGPELCVQLRQFFAAPGFTTLEASSRSGKEVFTRFFSRRPPFGSGKKKAEFPDAFVLDALLEVATERGQSIDVVSGDGDWASAIAEESSLRHYHSLGALLDELKRLPQAETVRAFAAFHAERHNLEHAIADIIVNQWVDLEDSVGEVLSVHVETVKVDEPGVMAFGDDGIVTLECGATAQLQLEVHVPREGSFVYDSEEKHGYYWDWSTVEIEREVDFVVDFSLNLEEPKKLEFETTPIRLNRGRPVTVFLDPDAKSHYK